MPWIRTTADWVTPYISVVGGWLGLMSGGLSIVLTVLALLNQWSARRALAIGAFAALWVLVFRMVKENLRQQEASKTRLTFACGENILPPTIGRNRNAFNSAGAVAATGDLFGFSLVNSGRGIINKCRAVLTSVERAGVILCSDSGALPFEPLDASADLVVLDLQPGFRQRATVCTIQDEGTVHAGSFGMLWRHSKFPEYFSVQGDYTLRVTVSAENHDPMYLNFMLHKGKNRAESSIELKSISTMPESYGS
jgi:hypothetical protein